MTVHLCLTLSLWTLLLSGSEARSKRIKNNKKSLFKKNEGEIETANYIGVIYGNKAKYEKNWFEAQKYCESEFGTTLATILEEEDQKEIVGLLSQPRWGNAVNNVWFGLWNKQENPVKIDKCGGGSSCWKPNLDELYQSWTPITSSTAMGNYCQHGWECDASDEAQDADWHKVGAREAVYTDPSGGKFIGCGYLPRKRTGGVGKWDTDTCTTKKDFICNKKNGKYDPLPFSYGPPTPLPTPLPTPAPICVTDTGLDIVLLIDENLNFDQFELVKQTLLQLVSDMNDASAVAVVEYTSEVWKGDTILPFTELSTGREAVVDAIQSNVISANEASGANVFGNTLDLTDTGNDRDDLLIMFIDGVNSFDAPNSDEVQGCPAYTVPGEMILIGVGGDDGTTQITSEQDILDNYNCLGKKATTVRYLADYTDLYTIEEELEEVICGEVSAGAKRKKGSMFLFDGQSISDDGAGFELVLSANVFYAMVALFSVLLVVNVVFMCNSVCNGNRKKRFGVKYDVVNVMSSDAESP